MGWASSALSLGVFHRSARKAGIADYLINYKPRILLIDEFDKMHIQDIAVLLSMMETGRMSEMLYGKTREVELDTVVFAAANTMKGLPPEAKSRFQILHFTEYSEDEFKHVVVNVLKRAWRKRGSSAAHRPESLEHPWKQRPKRSHKDSEACIHKGGSGRGHRHP